jgi:ribosomal protein L11 methylase PrmA
MIDLGTRFAVMGDWDTSPEPPDKIVIRMPPAPPGVYGCWNRTTRMCIEAMERRLEPGMSFLDFGTGSGILAVVAHHLGAEPVWAWETNLVAAEFALRMWVLNHVYSIKIDCPKFLPIVDLCVANVGDSFWNYRHLVNAKTIINISNTEKEVIVHA